MSGEDRANNPARKPSIALRATEGPLAGQVGGYERGSTGEFLHASTDYDAQVAFNAHGFNKGKAGDMAKNIQSNVDKSVARTDYNVKRARDKSESNIDIRSRS
jgi:hypothetical protein